MNRGMEHTKRLSPRKVSGNESGNDQGAELRALWEEFEAHATPEARYAAALGSP